MNLHRNGWNHGNNGIINLNNGDGGKINIYGGEGLINIWTYGATNHFFVKFGPAYIYSNHIIQCRPPGACSTTGVFKGSLVTNKNYDIVISQKKTSTPSYSLTIKINEETVYHEIIPTPFSTRPTNVIMYGRNTNPGMGAVNADITKLEFKTSYEDKFCAVEEGKYVCAADNQCPSTACWTYDPNLNKCILKDANVDCEYALECTKSAMKITFDHMLFGTDSDTIKSHFDTKDACMTVNSDQDGFTWEADLGSCEQVVGQMTDTEGTFITFEKTIADGDTDDGITLGSTQIYTSAIPRTAIKFTCKYSSSATTTSAAVDVLSPSVSGSVTKANGKFDGGLTLKFYDDNSYANLITGPADIGTTVYPMVKWEVTTLSGKVGFYVNKCEVINISQNTQKIAIVDDSCYATVVQAKYNDEKFGETEAKFEYTSFSFDTAAVDKQMLSCSIEFCTIPAGGITNNALCAIKTTNAECPTTAGYLYTWNGE